MMETHLSATLIDRYIRGLIDDAEIARAIEDHLTSCGRCESAVAAATAAWASTGGLLQYIPIAA